MRGATSRNWGEPAICQNRGVFARVYSVLFRPSVFPEDHTVALRRMARHQKVAMVSGGKTEIMLWEQGPDCGRAW